MRRTALAAACSLFALAARADPGLLGICSSVDSSRCVVGTPWSVSKVALTPELDNPVAAPLRFSVKVVEGATQSLVLASGGLSLYGLHAQGTQVAAIFFSLQKSDGAGGWGTLATSSVGDASTACGCPSVPGSDLTVAVRNANGTPLAPAAGAPVATLQLGDALPLTFSAVYDRSGSLTRAGDALRLSACVSYRLLGASFPPGCFADGGGIRSVKSCSALAASCSDEQATISLHEALGTLDAPAVATLSAITATPASGQPTPAGARALPPGSSLDYSIARSGVAGTTTELIVAGTATCAACAQPGGCVANLPNEATLTASPTWPAQLGAAITGSPADASIKLVCTPPPPVCTGLGPAAAYDVFVAGDFDAASSDVEGAVTAGGHLTATDESFGGGLHQPATALVAVGPVTLTRGTVYGDLWHAGALTSSATLFGIAHPSTPFNVPQAWASMTALSARLALLPANGTAASAYGALTLTGTDPVRNVFDVSAAVLSSSSSMALHVPGGSTALVRVSGAAAASFTNASFDPGAAGADHVLLQFVDATSLRLSSIGLSASVLATSASVSFDNGNLSGQIIAGSFHGGGQVNHHPFGGCLPP